MRSNKTDVVFEGTLEECFKHCRENKELEAVIRQAQEFVGVSRLTVTRWFDQQSKIMPKGINLLKLRFFLELLGYSVQEINNTDTIVAEFARCVAFGLLGEEKVTQFLGYKDKDSVSKLLLGRQGFTKSKQRIMEDFAKENKDLLRKKVREWQNRVGLSDEDFDESNGHSCGEKKAPKCSDETKIDEIEILAHLLRATLLLAQRVASDEFSPEDREKLRETSGRYTVLHLTNALTALCGERARSNSRERSTGGPNHLKRI